MWRRATRTYSGGPEFWSVEAGKPTAAGGVSSLTRVVSRGSHWPIIAVNAWARAPIEFGPDLASMYASTFLDGQGSRYGRFVRKAS